jgi:DNA-binding transcriptional LysR family regulator
MSDRHPLAGKRFLTAQMIASQPLVLYAADQMDQGLLASLRPLLEHEPQVAHRAASTLGVLALVAAGLGIALVPDPMLQLAIPNLIYKPLKGMPISANLLLVSRREESSGAVNAYLTLARE